MSEIITKQICNKVRVHNLVDKKFKTMRVSVNMVVPLELDTAARNALLPAIVSRATKEYPDYTELSKYLSGLYGSSLTSSISKIGDNQVLSISSSGISNKYALDKEDIGGKLTELICSTIFEPLTDEDHNFPQDGFIQEKRQLLETIDANFNDKKVYAKRRCLEIFFDGEPAAVSRYGTKETVAEVRENELYSAWQSVLKKATFEIFIMGDCDFDKICGKISPYFNYEREPSRLTNKITLSASAVKNVTEKMQIAQSKLVMAFRTGVIPEDSTPTRVMAVLFGGSPSSKLFLNVREKMSLCYYCSARISEEKGAMFVESGVENENTEKARDAIIQQLEDIKDGKFTDEDLEYAKLAMINCYKSVGDSLYAVENWYLNQIFSGEMLTPEDTIEKIKDVTRIDIIAAARKVTLDTVYTLKGE